MITRKRFLLSMILFAGLLFLAACGALPGAQDAADAGTAGEAEMKVDSGPLRNTAAMAEGPAARGAAITSDAAAACLSAEEADLIRRINEYRATKNLPAIPASKSLTLVAQQHAWDSNNNSDAWPAPPPGKECNMHSWSGNVNPALQQGQWTAVCFTGSPDWDGLQGMWDKPRELSGYPTDGYENSHWASNGTTAAGALEGWKNSPGHNALITEQDDWGPFKALGVGISGNYAHMWVGTSVDPAGEAQLCSGGNVGAPAPTTVPPTAVPTTAAPPTAVPTTAAPPTAVPTTAAPPTAVPTTAAPPTAVPTTAAPPTAAPTTAEPGTPPQAGTVLTSEGEVTSGDSATHTFDVTEGGVYTILVTPSDDFDAAPDYSCTMENNSRSGSFDEGFEGEAETATFTATGNGTCTVTIGGYLDSAGTYTIEVTAQ